MKHDLTLAGAALISGCIIAGGVLIGALTFSVEVPFAPYIMVTLAALIVLGAAMLILSCRTRGDLSLR
ncbi:hypothetical protein [Methanoculleus bourgensis]|uniref:hypothetical protein n=1 Tax=Methanoculleus bourgensis TaxID=83986 RepID=UPI0022EF2351|nr:hypothetical protein [Methanoculleus bourgensis]GLI47126.1 hypothetical protein MBOURGENBZM_19180 [Methanoculleus bourgensis]